jgi:hypothetical protein
VIQEAKTVSLLAAGHSGGGKKSSFLLPVSQIRELFPKQNFPCGFHQEQQEQNTRAALHERHSCSTARHHA